MLRKGRSAWKAVEEQAARAARGRRRGSASPPRNPPKARGPWPMSLWSARRAAPGRPLRTRSTCSTMEQWHTIMHDRARLLSLHHRRLRRAAVLRDPGSAPNLGRPVAELVVGRLARPDVSLAGA